MQMRVPHFTDSIFYSIEQIARYLELHGKEFFATVSNGEFSLLEYKTLDIIICNPDICQRDLAKLILQDRVRTGRLLDSLEEKGFIKRFVDTKNNRVVKKMQVTKKGEDFIDNLTNKMQPYLDNLCTKFTSSQVNELKNLLELLKKALSENVKLQV